jgi:hypothetical protein
VREVVESGVQRGAQRGQRGFGLAGAVLEAGLVVEHQRIARACRVLLAAERERLVDAAGALQFGDANGIRHAGSLGHRGEGGHREHDGEAAAEGKALGRQGTAGPFGAAAGAKRSSTGMGIYSSGARAGHRRCCRPRILVD